MRKKSHISLARFLLKNMEKQNLYEHRKAFYLGSVLPDLKPSFLTRRHNIEGTFDILIKEIKRLTINYDANKGISRYYARHLGVITHYLADYCTYPHNSEYTGTFADHVSYEKEMKIRLKEYVELDELQVKDNKGHKLLTIDDIVNFIEKTHKDYLKSLRAIEKDIYYIIELCSKVVHAILLFFELEFEGFGIDTGPTLQYNQM